MNQNKFSDIAAEPSNLGKLGGALRFEGVAKRYGDFEAVKSLDLSIAPGEFLTLLGPSGSGKTTGTRTNSQLILPPRRLVILIDTLACSGRSTPSMTLSNKLGEDLSYVVNFFPIESTSMQTGLYYKP